MLLRQRAFMFGRGATPPRCWSATGYLTGFFLYLTGRLPMTKTEYRVTWGIEVDPDNGRESMTFSSFDSAAVVAQSIVDMYPNTRIFQRTTKTIITDWEEVGFE
jgi:hypothetical protein